VGLPESLIRTAPDHSKPLLLNEFGMAPGLLLFKTDARYAAQKKEDETMANETILIVDDNAMNLKLGKRLLETENFQVLTAKNAQETLELLKRFQPRLILMDFQLPEMDGVELTKKLREDLVRQETVIVMVTSYDLKGDEQKARAAGCDGYLQKPINTQELPVIVRDYLKKGRGPAGEKPKT
jgi:CheY-like chemotaxis protein